MAQKKTVLLDDSESEIDDLNVKAENNSAALKINSEYAKRFEHNKKREELQRLEEKYGKVSVKRRRADSRSSSGSGSEDDSSSDEEEDEQGELITDTIDSEISATLAAIRNKDPRVYNSDVVFFSNEGDGSSAEQAPKKEKSMTLKQYHQTNIMSGYTGDGDGDNSDDKNGDDLKGRVNLYDREQEQLKRELIGALNGALSESEGEDADLFKRKEKPREEQDTDAGQNFAAAVALPTNPDADPERFLDTFFSTKAWMPKGETRGAAFESDDSEDEREASDFENAYNMRFEDPSLASRAVITTHSRDVASKLTLRREEKSKRKKARDLKKEKKEREISTQKSEQKRLRKLKIEELEKKFEMVKEAGGLDLAKLDVDGIEGNNDWVTFLEQEWNGADDWDANMARFFGSDYYSKEDKKEKKPKKPTWDDDIDIKDLVPDFEDDETDAKPAADAAEITSQAGPSSHVEYNGEDYDMDVDNDDQNEGINEISPVDTKTSSKKPKGKSKDVELRDKIETFVDDHLKVMSIRNSSKAPSSFRYRAVSPQSFHLSSSDILFASDKQLNEYAGLKKLASFRDEKKKTKDLRKYTKGNKYKLREWRKEVFADGIPHPTALAGDSKGTSEERNASGVATSVNKKIEIVGKDDDASEPTRQSGGKRAKKRRRKNKTSAAV